MNKNHFFPICIFIICICIAHLQTGSGPVFISSHADNEQLDIKSINVLDHQNRLALGSLKPEQNLAAGLLEVTPYQTLPKDPNQLSKFIEDHQEEILYLEQMLGIKLNLNAKAQVSAGDIVSGVEIDPTRIRQLERERPVLNQIVQRLNREGFSEISYHESGSLLQAPLFFVDIARTVSRTLRQRGKLSLSQNRIDSALDDIQAILKLGNALTTNASYTATMLVGVNIFSSGTQLLCEAISHPTFTSEHVQRVRGISNDMSHLPALNRIFCTNKLTWLDAFKKMELFGPQSFFEYISGARQTSVEFFAPQIAALANWSDIYDFLNYKHSLYESAASEHDPQKQLELIRSNKLSINKRLQSLDVITRLLMQPIHALDIDYLATAESAQKYKDTVNIVDTCLAIKSFHLKQNRYPKHFNELVGDYIEEVPCDFKGRPLGFKHLANGVVIYTLGHNNIDDDGWGGNFRSAQSVTSTDWKSRPDDQTYTIGEDDRISPFGTTANSFKIPGTKWSQQHEEWQSDNLAFADEVVTTDDLARISKVQTLTRLILSHVQIVDGWEKILPKLSSLQFLTISNTTIDDGILNALAELPKLAILELIDSTITGDLGQLAKIDSLEVINLRNSKITTNSLQQIQNIDSLELVRLDKVGFDTTAIDAICKLPKLKHLYLPDTDVTDDDVLKLLKIKSLESLNLDYTQISDKALVSATHNGALTVLSLNGTGISEKSLGFLSSLEQHSARNTIIDTSNTNEQSTNAQPALPFGKSSLISGNQFAKNGDDFPLEVSLNIERGYSEADFNALQAMNGDFDIRIKVSPNWESLDGLLLVPQVSSTIFAGIVVRDRVGHILEWGWNNIQDMTSPFKYRYASSPYPMVRRHDYMTSEWWSVPKPFIDDGDVWLRLRRVGNNFIASRSLDGTTWNTVTTFTSTVGENVSAGFACHLKATIPTHGIHSKLTWKVSFDDFQITDNILNEPGEQAVTLP